MSETKMKNSLWTIKIVCNEDNKNLKIYNLNYGMNTIGRARSNNIILENETISRYHCQLWIENNGMPLIKDLGSKNGTVVQNVKLEGVEDYLLKENDTISLSDNQKGVSFQVCLDKKNLTFSNIQNKNICATHFEHKVSRMNIQEINISDTISLLHNDNGFQLDESTIKNENEKLKDEDYYTRRERLATEWATRLQKLINSN